MPQRTTHYEMTGAPDPARVMAMLAEMDPEGREQLEKMMRQEASK